MFEQEKIEKEVYKLTMINYFKKKYDHIEEFELEELYNSAYELLLNLLYPFDFSKIEIPSNIFSRHKSWIRRAMQEFIERNGMTSYLAYSENGISIKMDREQISQSLISEVTPFGSVR